VKPQPLVVCWLAVTVTAFRCLFASLEWTLLFFSPTLHYIEPSASSSSLLNTPTKNINMEGEASRVDGADTRIILSNRRHFMAHSVILKQRSTLFKEMLEKESEVRNADIHYQIVLQNYDKKTGKEINPVFRRIPLDSNGHPTRPVTVIREGHDARDNLRLYGYFDRIIATFFDEDLTLDTTDITTTLEDAAGLVNAAEYLGSVSEDNVNVCSDTLLNEATRWHKSVNSLTTACSLWARLSSRLLLRTPSLGSM